MRLTHDKIMQIPIGQSFRWKEFEILCGLKDGAKWFYVNIGNNFIGESASTSRVLEEYNKYSASVYYGYQEDIKKQEEKREALELEWNLNRAAEMTLEEAFQELAELVRDTNPTLGFFFESHVMDRLREFTND